MTARAYLDTNVFLQFRPLREWDWCALLESSSVELVIKPVVVRELEGKKHGENRRLRKRATAGLRLITDIVTGSLAGPVRHGVTLRFDAAEPAIDFQAHGFSREVPDDWLLASLVEDGAAAPVMVTDDTTLTLKARSKGIRTKTPPDEMRLPPDEDEDIKRLESENRELRQQLAKRPDLELTFEDNTAVLRVQMEPPALISDWEIDREVSRKGAELRQAADIRARSPYRPFDRLDRARYDERELETYLAEMRTYRRTQRVQEEARARSRAVQLRLDNRGFAPATGIELYLRSPTGVAVAPTLVLPPAREPRLPAFFRSPGDVFPDAVREALWSSFIAPLPADGWTLSEDRRSLRLTVEHLVHKTSLRLDDLWITFPVVDGRPVGFSLEANILVSSPPLEVAATLSLVPEEGDGPTRSTAAS